jgi:hypothetical protein
MDPQYQHNSTCRHGREGTLQEPLRAPRGHRDVRRNGPAPVGKTNGIRARRNPHLRPARRSLTGVLLFFRNATAEDDDGGFGKLKDVVRAGGDG